MVAFVDKLLQLSRKNKSWLCVGLDVDLDLLPKGVLAHEDPVFTFNKAIIDATVDVVCAYKPNLAFYEALGISGLEALQRTLRYIPAEIPTIADAKRNDIGSSARSYARSILEVFGFDALTVNPYLGHDSLQPFLDYKEKGVLVLCKTSNPGATDFQDLFVTDTDSRRAQRLYEIIAERVVKWNIYGNCGLVVGATYPMELKRVREIAPTLPILIPGIGAQKGDLEASVRYGSDEHGELAIISSSRQVLYASVESDFALAARRVALSLREEINRFRQVHQRELE
ncbi:MAG: orotidine-5'-phosphate decarboxylase [Chloroflexi bacterium]|nr:orotidine-5'-phosphate decarboxylase [Chloroflexota bacterium]